MLSNIDCYEITLDHASKRLDLINKTEDMIFLLNVFIITLFIASAINPPGEI